METAFPPEVTEGEFALAILSGLARRGVTSMPNHLYDTSVSHAAKLAFETLELLYTHDVSSRLYVTTGPSGLADSWISEMRGLQLQYYLYDSDVIRLKVDVLAARREDSDPGPRHMWDFLALLFEQLTEGKDPMPFVIAIPAKSIHQEGKIATLVLDSVREACHGGRSGDEFYVQLVGEGVDLDYATITRILWTSLRFYNFNLIGFEDDAKTYRFYIP